MSRKIISLVLSLCFIFQQTGLVQAAAVELNLSNYFARMASSMAVDSFRPVHLRYFSYDSLNNSFKVLLDKGTDPKQTEAKLKEETKELLKYFLIGVTLPNDKFWVNLRPDSPEQIIDFNLEETDIGKIMLEADLQLKKDTAAFTSPQTPEGKEYWNRLYKKAEEIYGTENITIPTLTRPWIIPNEIIVRETKDSAYIYKATLKVMLEQDYLKDSSAYNFKDSRSKALNEYSSQLIRELIIPKLTKEVNLSKSYAPLRQVYYSLILSRWFKSRFYGKSGVYASLIDKNDLTNLTSKDNWSKTTYFNQYKKSFADGEYNIKEPVYTPSGQTIRSYFSGGINAGSPLTEAMGNKFTAAGPAFNTLQRILIPATGNGLNLELGNLETTQGAASPVTREEELKFFKQIIPGIELLLKNKDGLYLFPTIKNAQQDVRMSIGSDTYDNPLTKKLISELVQYSGPYTQHDVHSKPLAQEDYYAIIINLNKFNALKQELESSISEATQSASQDKERASSAILQELGRKITKIVDSLKTRREEAQSQRRNTIRLQDADQNIIRLNNLYRQISEVAHSFRLEKQVVRWGVEEATFKGESLNLGQQRLPANDAKLILRNHDELFIRHEVVSEKGEIIQTYYMFDQGLVERFFKDKIVEEILLGYPVIKFSKNDQMLRILAWYIANCYLKGKEWRIYEEGIYKDLGKEFRNLSFSALQNRDSSFRDGHFPGAFISGRNRAEGFRDLSRKMDEDTREELLKMIGSFMPFDSVDPKTDSRYVHYALRIFPKPLKSFREVIDEIYGQSITPPEALNSDVEEFEQKVGRILQNKGFDTEKLSGLEFKETGYLRPGRDRGVVHYEFGKLDSSGMSEAEVYLVHNILYVERYHGSLDYGSRTLSGIGFKMGYPENPGSWWNNTEVNVITCTAESDKGVKVKVTGNKNFLTQVSSLSPEQYATDIMRFVESKLPKGVSRQQDSVASSAVGDIPNQLLRLLRSDADFTQRQSFITELHKIIKSLDKSMDSWQFTLEEKAKTFIAFSEFLNSFKYMHYVIKKAEDGHDESFHNKGIITEFVTALDKAGMNAKHKDDFIKGSFLNHLGLFQELVAQDRAPLLPSITYINKIALIITEAAQAAEINAMVADIGYELKNWTEGLLKYLSQAEAKQPGLENQVKSIREYYKYYVDKELIKASSKLLYDILQGSQREEGLIGRLTGITQLPGIFLKNLKATQDLIDDLKLKAARLGEYIGAEPAGASSAVEVKVGSEFSPKNRSEHKMKIIGDLGDRWEIRLITTPVQDQIGDIYHIPKTIVTDFLDEEYTLHRIQSIIQSCKVQIRTNPVTGAKRGASSAVEAESIIKEVAGNMKINGYSLKEVEVVRKWLWGAFEIFPKPEMIGAIARLIYFNTGVNAASRGGNINREIGRMLRESDLPDGIRKFIGDNKEAIVKQIEGFEQVIKQTPTTVMVSDKIPGENKEYSIPDPERLAMIADLIMDATGTEKISVGGTSSSAVVPETTGGIDFRNKAMASATTYEAMGSFAGLDFSLPKLSSQVLLSFNLDKEQSDISRAIDNGILVSGQRIKEFMAASNSKGELEQRRETVITWLAKLGILEETTCCTQESSKEYREALVIADSAMI